MKTIWDWKDALSGAGGFEGLTDEQQKEFEVFVKAAVLAALDQLEVIHKMIPEDCPMEQKLKRFIDFSRNDGVESENEYNLLLH